MVLFCDSLALSLNKNIVNHVVYFDFVKSFDTVNHDILLHKLKNLYKIDGTPLNFLTDYLKGRHHLVDLGNESSATLAGNSGLFLKVLFLVLYYLFYL